MKKKSLSHITWEALLKITKSEKPQITIYFVSGNQRKMLFGSIKSKRGALHKSGFVFSSSCQEINIFSYRDENPSKLTNNWNFFEDDKKKFWSKEIFPKLTQKILEKNWVSKKFSFEIHIFRFWKISLSFSPNQQKKEYLFGNDTWQ